MFDRHGVNGNAEFFRPATAGSFGAVAALARVREFDVEKTIDALGIQLGQIGGTMQVHEEGSPLLGMQLDSVRSAVMSSDMAVAGISGALAGYWKAITDTSRCLKVAPISKTDLRSRRGLAEFAVFRTNLFQAVARHTGH